MQTFVEYERRDLLIGAFVLLSLILAVSVVFVKLRWKTGYYTITAEFSHISTVNEATKVRLRGYEIGYVRGVHFFPVPVKPGIYFRVDLAIRKAYPLFLGTRAQIRGGGLVGDRFIELEVPEVVGARLRSKDIISGDVPDEFGETLSKAREMMSSVARMARRIDQADIGEKFTRFVTHTRGIKEASNRLAQSGSRAFKSMGGAFADMRVDMGQAMAQLNENLIRVEAILCSADTILIENRAQIRTTMDALSASLTRLDAVVADVDSLTSGSRDDILQSIKNLQEASASLKDLAKHPWKLFTGKIE